MGFFAVRGQGTTSTTLGLVCNCLAGSTNASLESPKEVPVKIEDIRVTFVALLTVGEAAKRQPSLSLSLK